MIEVRDVTFVPPGREAPSLDAVTFTLHDGERAVLLGGNGSGKTTLVRLLNGTLQPTSGQVIVDGFDPRDAAAHEDVCRRVGLLFQDPDDQFVTTTLEREIAFGLENLSVPQPQMRTAVDAAMRDFGLLDLRNAPPHEMSGGEKARLALACVWVMGPRTLLLDETESLLDRRGAERLHAGLDALPRQTSVLHVTTDAGAIAGHSRVLVLHAGRLVADGPPDATFAALPDDVLRRIDTPLAWRISRGLCDAGRLAQPTASWPQLLQQLDVGEPPHPERP